MALNFNMPSWQRQPRHQRSDVIGDIGSIGEMLLKARRAQQEQEAHRAALIRGEADSKRADANLQQFTRQNDLNARNQDRQDRIGKAEALAKAKGMAPEQAAEYLKAFGYDTNLETYGGQPTLGAPKYQQVAPGTNQGFELSARPSDTELLRPELEGLARGWAGAAVSGDAPEPLRQKTNAMGQRLDAMGQQAEPTAGRVEGNFLDALDEVATPAQRDVVAPGKQYRRLSVDGRTYMDEGADEQRARAEQERVSGIANQALEVPYAKVASAMVQSGVPPKDAYTQALKLQMEDAEAKRLADRQAHSDAMREKGWDKAMQRTLAGRNNVTPGQESSATTTVLGAIRSDVDKFTDQQGYGTITKDLTEAQKALKGIESGNAKTIQSALFGYGKATAGVGSFTQAEQDAIINRTGSTWDQIANKLSLGLQGDYSDDVVQVFRAALEVKRDMATQQLKDAQGAYRSKFRQGTAYQNVQRNVIDEEKALFGRYGLPVEDDEGAQGISYGTPTQQKAAAKARANTPKPAKADPNADSAKMLKLAPADRDAVKWARANPGDPRSAAILQANGF